MNGRLAKSILHYLCAEHLTPGFECLLISNCARFSATTAIVRSFKSTGCLLCFNSVLREKNCALTSAAAVVNAAVNAGNQEREVQRNGYGFKFEI